MQNKFFEFLDSHRDIKAIEMHAMEYPIGYCEVTMRSSFSSAAASYTVPIIGNLDIEGLLLNLYHMIKEEEANFNDHH